MSIKNQIAISIAHVHSFRNSIIKTLHYIFNITTTEAKLFAIRYNINQAVQITSINHIVIITDSIHAVHKIFDLSVF